ncbi:MAG: hypothetical protein JW750_03710 [Anaerolineaceae bacterium]|nr:hypothetical protein [Anaerolineaceae bacterium]
MNYILGIDQGGSKTHALISDLEGNLLGFGTAHGSCHAVNGMEHAMNAVREASDRAIETAGISPSSIRHLYAGMTGADWDYELILLQEQLRALQFTRQVSVSNDAIIALRGGSDSPYGVILIAGSGGNCAVRSPNGQEFIYGYFHDPALQGGNALGKQMLNAVFRAHTFRGQPTLLTELILAQTGFDSVTALCEWYFRKQPALLGLAPLLFKAASLNDPTANMILDTFASGYAEEAVGALRHFDMLSLNVAVVLSGSIFKAQGGNLPRRILNLICKDAPGAHLIQARYEPVVGAVLLGLEASRIRVTSAIDSNIQRGARGLNLLRGVSSKPEEANA